MSKIRTALVIGGLLVFSYPVIANQTEIDELGLEALMSLDVQASSVMKRAESVIDTPASIYVLTAEQIHRSGATTLSQAIGLIPGLFYRESNNGKLYLGIRKPADVLGTNILVMVDGRYFYNPAFPGVTWEHLDIPLRDIESIELIRGSGGTLWSSKAANGVINIITRHTVDTLGSELTLAADNEAQKLINFRYGGQFREQGSYRINLKARQVDQTDNNNVSDLAGLSSRLDYNFNDDLSLMAKFDYLELDQTRVVAVPEQTSPFTNQIVDAETEASRSNVMLRMDHRVSESMSQLVQLSYSESEIALDVDATGTIEILNLNYGVNTEIGSHKLDLGVEYQYNDINTVESDYFSLPDSIDTTYSNYAVFLQDEYQLVPDSVVLYTALRADKDPLDSWQYQPSVRLMHHLSPSSRVWGGISRSVMTPTLLYAYADVILPTIVPSVRARIRGSGLDTVRHDNIELGYRASFDKLEIDLSLYQIKSDNDIGLKGEDINIVPGFPPGFELVTGIANGVQTRSVGGEMVVNLKPSSHLNLQLAFNYLNYKSDSNNALLLPLFSTGIQKSYSLRADYQISNALSTYLRLEHQSEFSKTNSVKIDPFTTLDAGVTWQLSPAVEFGVYGQNLLDASHEEISVSSALKGFTTSEIERNILFRGILRF